ncbi:hypothetical protein [Arenimonas composti]|uniref:hypothetical protein n=1 Tax=Arenimonas composti TaxID=370776 RepID=UPI0012B62550|nr:hypothetical protein [Arenimonas composti]
MFDEHRFLEIAVRNGADRPQFAGTKPCPDLWIGQLSCVGDRNYCREDSPFAATDRRLILILESPHKMEYPTCGGGRSKVADGPARGPTGVRLRNGFDRLIRRHGEFESLPGATSVILMNAIQFPCSLFENTSRHRDRVFEDCWNDGAREEFADRLDNYARHDAVIVNACTRGTGATPLHELVRAAIFRSHWRIAHPFSWTARTRVPSPIPQRRKD